MYMYALLLKPTLMLVHVRLSLCRSGKGWPLNYHFVFDLLAVGGGILVIVTLLLPKSIELKRLRQVDSSSSYTAGSETGITIVARERESDSENSQDERT